METGFYARMLGYYPEVFATMMKLREERKDFVGDDDLGVFYRNQRLVTMIRDGEVNMSNLSEYMTKEKMSEGDIPMDWFYLNGYTNPQQVQYDLMYKNFVTAREKKNKRGRLTPLRLKQLFMDILISRVDRYEHPEKYVNNKILCIVGQSGAGKTLCSLHLQNKLQANVICSFTTRPPRPTEIEGREHHFINILPDPDDILAYTYFGGYEYYALKTQVFGDCTVYVIDEKGLLNLKKEHGDEYRIYSVYIRRDWSKRLVSGVKKKRLERDAGRMQLPESEYDWVIDNNSTKKQLFINIERIYNEVKGK